VRLSPLRFVDQQVPIDRRGQTYPSIARDEAVAWVDRREIDNVGAPPVSPAQPELPQAPVSASC
jgi:hypothetical protein